MHRFCPGSTRPVAIISCTVAGGKRLRLRKVSTFMAEPFMHSGAEIGIESFWLSDKN